MDNYLGTKLDGRYQVEELIGEGGMADVYRGTDLKDGSVVAIKILKDEFRDNEELVRRFKNESRAISVLNHANIVKVYDMSVDDKIHFIVMEHIDGITLKEYIEQRGEPLTYKETIHFIAQILQALQHAHDKGIVHRDIKPQNIMILEDGTVKVMDFGIARLARSENHTVTDQAIGSVHYISPEQAKGDLTDQRADIYSVGIMMYEMLTAKLPFESDDAVSIAIKQISDEAPPVRMVNPAAPEGLSDITTKAMTKDPRFRYQSAMDMLRDIEEFKRNPSIKFEYDYLTDNAPTRYIDKVVNHSKRPAGAAGTARKKAKKKKKVGLLVPIVLGFTIAVMGACTLLSYNLLKNSGNPLFSSYEDIELPDFVGMSYTEVETMLRKEPYNHLRLEQTERFNLDVTAGTIVSQNPTSNNENKKNVKANQRIFLTVSKGVEDVTIPDVSGMTRNEAVKVILALGVRPYAMRVEAPEVPIGRVVGTDPAANTTIENRPDSIVKIMVSGQIPSTEIKVPQLIGQVSKEAAASILRGQELQLGVVTEGPGDAEPGTVISQSPAAGTTVGVGDQVHIVICTGPPPPVDDGGGNSEETPDSQAPIPPPPELTDPVSIAPPPLPPESVADANTEESSSSSSSVPPSLPSESVVSTRTEDASSSSG